MNIRQEVSLLDFDGQLGRQAVGFLEIVFDLAVQELHGQIGVPEKVPVDRDALLGFGQKFGATDALEPLRVTPSLSSRHGAEDRNTYLELLDIHRFLRRPHSEHPIFFSSIILDINIRGLYFAGN